MTDSGLVPRGKGEKESNLMDREKDTEIISLQAVRAILM